jgi:hypothetical protein
MNTKQVKKLVGNTFFSATFVKKDGTLRKMHCRCGVKKGLKGVGKNYNDVDYNLLTVYDIKKQGYRTINLNTLKELRAKGKVIKC